MPIISLNSKDCFCILPVYLPVNHHQYIPFVVWFELKQYKINPLNHSLNSPHSLKVKLDNELLNILNSQPDYTKKQSHAI